ncbi:MAG: hypothetical protein HFH08_02755 [Bacilli bacterium]|nr:hypothetical protein [Bacilli bacterium]
MNNNSMIKLYIKHLIIPLETLIKSPNFFINTPKEKQQIINQLLLSYYQQIETIMNEKN